METSSSIYPVCYSREALKQREAWRIFHLALAVLVALSGTLIANEAFALPPVECSMVVLNALGVNFGGGVNPICDVFIDLKDLIAGETGKVIATVAIIALGLLALFGKLTYPQALVTALGVGLIFGAASLMHPQGASVTFTASSDPISSTLNMVQNAIQSEGGRALGVVGIGILGIGALFGKISWPQGLMWVAGIGMLFGATSLVKRLWDLDPADILLLSGAVGVDHANALVQPFMNVIALITSETGVAIGSIGVIALGCAALLGKISWVRAFMLCVGIAILFGCADIMYILSGTLSPCTAGTTGDDFTTVICAFMEEMQGPMGRTIATLAIIVVGILSMLGKISWELSLVVIVGIALVFGANQIVNLLEMFSPYGIQGITCGSTPPTPPSTGNAIADALCYTVMILYGPAGKALATASIIMMGFGALMGKVSYSQAFIVALGIAVTFGAPQIVALLLPSASTTGCTLTPHITPGFVFGTFLSAFGATGC